MLAAHQRDEEQTVSQVSRQVASASSVRLRHQYERRLSCHAATCRYQKYPSKENNSGASNNAGAAHDAPSKASAVSLATRQAAVLLAQQQQLQQQQERQATQHMSISSSLDSLHSSGTVATLKPPQPCDPCLVARKLFVPTASHSLSSLAAYGSETPALQPAYEQPTQHYTHPAQTLPAALLHDNYRETLGQVSYAIRHDVDQFLVALPLGTSPDDAAVEEAVASKLYEALLSKAVMQHKLTEW